MSSNGRKRWTAERDAMLRAHYATMEWQELVVVVKADRTSIKNRAYVLGLKRPRQQHRWTAEQLAYLDTHYATESAVEMAANWGVSPCVVYRMAKHRGLEKAPDFLSKLAIRTDLPGRGAAHGFKKGSVPRNKGQKMAAQQYAIAQATMFRKGQKPHNALPLGATRVNGDGYLDRKVRATGYPPDDWEGVHRLVWREHHGDIPPGRVVCFKPGSRTTVEADITIDAIECLSKRERMARNTVHNLPAELKSTIQTKAILKRMINKRTKDHEQEQAHK